MSAAPLFDLKSSSAALYAPLSVSWTVTHILTMFFFLLLNTVHFISEALSSEWKSYVFVHRQSAGQTQLPASTEPYDEYPFVL